MARVVPPMACTAVSTSASDITKSATGFTVLVSLALQVPGPALKLRALGAGSVVQLAPELPVPAGGVTLAVLVTVPVVAVTVAAMIYVTTPPLASVAVVLSGPVPDAAPQAVVTLPMPGVVATQVHAPSNNGVRGRRIGHRRVRHVVRPVVGHRHRIGRTAGGIDCGNPVGLGDHQVHAEAGR